MMMDRYIKFLSQSQLSTGQFMGFASFDPDNFLNPVQQSTTFFTSLILSCLNDIPGVVEVKNLAANWLLSQRSESWSWNYWQKKCAQRALFPYPDDLDDTVYALSSLAGYRPDLINGQVLGRLAKHLIDAESRPGGPYHTWLGNAAARAGQSDIDVSVNANIGYFLSRQQVNLKPLNHYLDELIEHDRLLSKYYLGQAPAIYFLARWYKGPSLDKLRRLAEVELGEAVESKNALRLALLITAGHKLQIGGPSLNNAASALVDLSLGDHWAASGLYRDPKVDSRPMYAGSTVLTTAFAVQALSLVQADPPNRVIVAPRRYHKPELLQNVRKTAQCLPAELSVLYLKHAGKLVYQDTEGQVCHISNIAAEACDLPQSLPILPTLNMASLNGWLAYSIYDDVMDELSNTNLLGLANTAQRLALQQFKQVPDSDFQAHVETVFDRMDAANTWEAECARGKFTAGRLVFQNWPNYDNFQKLTDKSFGHGLAAQAVYILAGHSLNGPRQKAIQQFFQNYLIARQLNDDAHDWEHDLAKGRLSPVVSLLLNRYGRLSSYDLKRIMPQLKELFWRAVINEVATLIQEHVRLARSALKDAAVPPQHTFYSWLSGLHNAAMLALKERDESLKFMAVFK